MTQDKIYLVGTLGLHKHEMRFIKIMLGLTSHAQNSRAQGQYELSEDFKNLDIIIVNADDDAAIRQWRDLFEHRPSTTLLLVAETDQAPFCKHYLSRPFGPAKTLMLLDKIVKERLEKGAETDIFAGSVNSEKRKVLASQGGIPFRHRALVVDDSATVRKQLVLELASFNIKVDTAESGEQGLDMLEKNHYDIIFLDVVMPGTNGYQVCKLIRKNKKTKLIPVVMLTSKSSPFDKVLGTLAGCNAYLIKPVDHENFYHVLEEYLAQTQGAVKVKDRSEQLMEGRA